MQDAAPLDLDAADGPKVSSFRLENGMEGVVIEDHRAPVVTHMVWYRVGAADEPRGKSGVAHFLEHLMFKGTDAIPPGRFSKIVSENGGQDNAFTSYDYTAYFQRIAKDRLEMVMKMEADRMANLRLTEDDVRTERDVVLEERSTRTDNDPQSLFYEQFGATMYMNHPYGTPIIGWRREIEKLSREQALAFYRRYYAPDNAILVVAGDVTPAEVEALAKAHYGPLKPSGAPRAERPQEPPQLAERRVAMSDPRVRQPYVTRAYLTPSYRTAEPGRAEALVLLGEILGGGASGRLHKRMVLGTRSALDAGAYYRGLAVDDGSFNLYAVPNEGVTLETVEAELDAALKDIIENGPTAEEMARGKMVLVSSRIYQQDSQASLARLYGAALTIGLDIEHVKGWGARIQAVEAADVVAAAQSLRREASVTGYLTAAPEDEAAAPETSPSEDSATKAAAE